MKLNDVVRQAVLFTVIFAAAGYVVFNGPAGLVIGAVAGLLFPAIKRRLDKAARLRKFHAQLIDGIALLTSCLKAGLSFTQAIEVLVQEMPDPIAEEFGVVLKSLRIGVPLNEALEQLYRRVPCEELTLLFSSILVARETGGDLPYVLSRLIDTLRDRNRLKENISTYTIQGRIQGVIMGGIPLVFCYVVLQQDKHHFDIMFQSEVGRLLIVVAFVLQIAAIFFIIKCSEVKI
jgi:tight adherence protein B